MHSQQREADGVAPAAIDVHNHAMPLPLLEWLQGEGLADLSRFRDGIVLLDPVVSGVGKDTPLPLARSQYDAVTRLSEMDDVGVSAHAVSMPPFLYCSNSEDRRLVTNTIARGNDELAAYVAEGSGRLLGLGSIPLGFPDACPARLQSSWLPRTTIHGACSSSTRAGAKKSASQASKP